MEIEKNKIVWTVSYIRLPGVRGVFVCGLMLEKEA